VVALGCRNLRQIVQHPADDPASTNWGEHRLMPGRVGSVELQKQLLATELVELLTAIKRIEIHARFNVEGEEVTRHPDTAHLAADTSANRHQDDGKCDRNSESTIDHSVEAGIVLVVIAASVASKTKDGKDTLENVFKRRPTSVSQGIEFGEAILDNESIVKMGGKNERGLVGCDEALFAGHQDREAVCRFHDGEGIGLG
jgi:hypothetical protein